MTSPRLSRRLVLFVAAIVAAGGLCHSSAASNWAVSRVNHMVVPATGGVTIAEMSGVTYVGPVGGNHRFIAAQEINDNLVQFDLTLDASGAITAISNVTARNLSAALASANYDFEGIAYTNSARNSVFLSEENGPGVREVNLATGTSFQNLSIPAVFTTAGNKRNNRGFESLTRSPDGAVMWTANEEALTVDGPAATSAAGSVVRLLQLNVAGNSVSAGQEFAYNVEPIHDPNPLGGPQSGLSDLALMPDGTLLALERSVAVATPLYLNRIYETNLAAATDVSVGGLASGLSGNSYAPVAKTLLWAGAADGAAGQNLEGLTLGPRLANGSWVLIGVVDNGDSFSQNTVVAFTATANASADFDADGDVDGADLILWQRGLGKPIGAKHSDGDADRDGDVDAADLDLWKGGAIEAPLEGVIPEPDGASLVSTALAALACAARRSR